MDSSVAAIRSRFADRRRAALRGLLTEELVAGFARDANAPHREPLSWILRFLGQRPPAERITVHEDVPRSRWRLVRPPARHETYRVPCIGHHELDGRLVNLPVRGVTGRYYTGDNEHHAHDPCGYAAIHFHDDELSDANWMPSHEFTIPDELPSGVYALRPKAESCQRDIPFVVRPPRDHATGDLALLLPTATYLAYANERGLGYVPVVQQGTAFLEQRYDLGHSLYASHTDGSGVSHSSHRRPILTLAPSFRVHLSPFKLEIDLYIVDWLTELGYSFDVITDHDLHADGVELLRRYKGY